MNKPLINVEGLRVEFPSKRGAIAGVQDVSFTIESGEIVCIVGESGSGKSVSAYTLMQLTKFSGGWVADGRLTLESGSGNEINLRAVDETRMRTIRGNEIGMIFQEPMTALNPSYTIGWQLAESLQQHRGMSREEAAGRSVELLKQVRIPEPERRLKQYPHELSGGMRQRIVIAMALACEPRLLIADEPTTALDVTVQAEILALIRKLRDETGAAVLLITHDMAVVAQMADRVVVMKNGRVAEDGPVEQVLTDPQHPYTQALLAVVPKLGDMAGKTLPEPMETVATTECHIDKPLQPGSRVLLDVRHLTKRFPIRGGWLGRTVANAHAVEDVTFRLLENETLSLVGESGSGKSVTALCILRLERPDDGRITFDGQDLLTLSDEDMRLARRDMQMIFQDPYGSLNPHMSLLEQVVEPLRNFRLETGSALEDRAAELFDRVRLPRAFLRRHPSELSGGQRQRVAIARVLAPRPKLIIADEAVSALDVSIQAEVLNLMMELQAEMGISYLFIGHDMAVVERVSHRVAVMYLGRIVETGTREQIFSNPQHEYTKTLLAAVPTLDLAHRAEKWELATKPPPSPIHPVGYVPDPVHFENVTEGHFVLRSGLGSADERKAGP